MKTFNNLEEMQPYYNAETNTYVLDEDARFTFDLAIKANINAKSIDSWSFNAFNINASDIRAEDIKADNINAEDIEADNLDARDISARDIKARNIRADDIKARNINADDIIAYRVIAYSIDARDISFCDLCCAYEEFICNSIAGWKEKSKYFCLDGEVIIKEKSNV